MVDTALRFIAESEKISDMGRKRTQLCLTTSEQTELEQLLKQSNDPREKERLKFLAQATRGRFTLEELADLTGRSRSTIQNWLGKFASGRLKGLLERDAAPGRESPLALPKIQRQLTVALRSGRLKTAADVALWLREKHGFNRSRKSIYYWLRGQNSGVRLRHARIRATRSERHQKSTK
jgi:transposase